MDSRRKASLPKYAEGEARGSRNSRSSVNKQTVGQEKGVRYGPAHDNSLMLTAEGKVRGHIRHELLLLPIDLGQYTESACPFIAKIQCICSNF
jgi:hypothetical protein